MFSFCLFVGKTSTCVSPMKICNSMGSRGCERMSQLRHLLWVNPYNLNWRKRLVSKYLRNIRFSHIQSHHKTCSRSNNMPCLVSRFFTIFIVCLVAIFGAVTEQLLSSGRKAWSGTWRVPISVAHARNFVPVHYFLQFSSAFYKTIIWHVVRLFE